MSSARKIGASGLAHHSHTQPRKHGKFAHRQHTIAALAAAKPGSDTHAAALVAAAEDLLRVRRMYNGHRDFYAHNAAALHNAIPLGPQEYLRHAREARLLRHRPFRAQLHRWLEHERNQQRLE